VQLNHALVTDAIARLKLSWLTIDVDGTVVCTGATVAWAFRGFILRELIHHLRARFGRRLPLEFRMDAAFCQPDVFRLLAARGCGYAIPSPRTTTTANGGSPRLTSGACSSD
jgi:hypothetical protein